MHIKKMVLLHAILISIVFVVESSRLPFLNKPNLFSSYLLRSQSTSTKTSTAASESKAKAKSKPSNSPMFNVKFDFSLSSALTGIALSGAGYYYLESKDLNEKLHRNKLLSGDYDIDLETIDSKVLKDPKLFNESIKKGNEELCILILKSQGGSIKYDNNLLLKLIEKRMPKVIDFILSEYDENSLHSSCDSINVLSGKTPLLAALQSKMFPQARKLLKMGAKPLIPSIPGHPARGINDFLSELDDSEEAQLFLKELNEMYNKPKI